MIKDAWKTLLIVIVEILNFALTLEHLEDFFYRDAINNYTQQDFIDAGFADPFYDNLQKVSFDETTHVDFLTTALGDAAVAECTYSFPSTDVTSFVALASVLEGVGSSVSSFKVDKGRLADNQRGLHWGRGTCGGSNGEQLGVVPLIATILIQILVLNERGVHPRY